MTDDDRCCGTGTCLINEEGLCWCGQRWDGEKMCFSQATPGSDLEPQIDLTESGLKRSP